MENIFTFKPGVEKTEQKQIESTYDIVIIGAGPAGLTAALYSCRSKLKTIVFEKLFAGGEIATSEWVENFPGFPEGISGSELAERFKKQAIKFGASIVNESVSHITKTGDLFEITTETEIVFSKAIIVATGASPVKLPVAEEEKFRGRGISYCATCDAAFFKEKTVAVVGGGDTALHEAIYLSKFASEVILVHRRKELRGTQVLQEEAMKNPKIRFELEYIPIRVIGEKKVEALEIENVATKEKKAIKVDGIFVAIGTVPNSQIVETLVERDERGYIVVNQKMETTCPGIYAVGDVRNTPLKQVITACADGAIAAFEAEKYIKNITR